jgi:hypothetical protein
MARHVINVNAPFFERIHPNGDHWHKREPHSDIVIYANDFRRVILETLQETGLDNVDFIEGVFTIIKIILSDTESHHHARFRGDITV